MSDKFSLNWDGVRFFGSMTENKHVPAISLGPNIESGCHAVVMPTADAADSLILSCAGLKRPKHGQVSIGAENPYTTPKLRSQIVSLLAHELELELWSKRSRCSELFTYLLNIQPTVWRDASLRSILMSNLARFRDRLVHTLSGDERRIIMLEFALAHPSPKLALLYEPWSCVQALDGQAPERRLLGELGRLVQAGCIVVLFTVSEHQANRYSEKLIQPSTATTTRTPFSKFFRGVS